MSSSTDREIGPELSHYRISEKIHVGGLGEVYLAEDRKLDRRVALKVLPADLAADASRLERFTREARALASLHHPNIVTIYSVEEADGVHFVTLEPLDGETLLDLIPAEGLTIDRFFRIAIPLADALAAARDRGVLHGYLEPGNVIVTDDGRVKILDFGLRRTPSPMVTETQPLSPESNLTSTVSYMAPEQLQGRDDVDHRADIFSLGVVLYQMATGRAPFEGEHFADLVRAILKHKPPPVTACRASLPKPLARIIRHCLEKSPSRRFQTALDVRNELEALKQELDSHIFQVPPALRWRPASAFWLVAVAVGSALMAVLAMIVWQRFNNTEPSRRDRVAVLRFESLGAAEDEFFAAGIADEILSQLGATSLSAISQTTVRRYERAGKSVAEIGEQLRVDYLLEGVVRWTSRSGPSRVRVTAQLIHTADDRQLWSGQYDGAAEDVFATQSQIATQIVRQLETVLQAPQDRGFESRFTDVREAYLAYRRGLEYASRRDPRAENWHLAVRMLERAVKLDPQFAVAHAVLSEVHSLVYHLRIDASEGRLELARKAVDRALVVDPRLPEAQRALGHYYLWGLRDYPKALETLRRALADLPDDPKVREAIGSLYRRQGRWQESLELFKQAFELAPWRSWTAVELAQTYGFLRDYETADYYFKQAIALAPDQSEIYQAKALNDLRWKGAIYEARATLTEMPRQKDASAIFSWCRLEVIERNFQAALELFDHGLADVIGDGSALYPRHLIRAQVLRLMDETEWAQREARIALRVLERMRPRQSDPRLHTALALAHGYLGDRRPALAQARLAVASVPIEEDAYHGPAFAVHLAHVALLVGEEELAIEELERLLVIPSPLSAPLLVVDPRWDALRHHARFQSLVKPEAAESAIPEG